MSRTRSSVLDLEDDVEDNVLDIEDKVLKILDLVLEVLYVEDVVFHV